MTPPDMLQEYLKLTDIVSNFDSSLITVKSWGVTLGLAALGFGFKEKNWGYFLLAIVCGISFWAIEFTLEGHQMRYFPRMREIEYQMFLAKAPNAPRIDWSWNHADKIFEGSTEPGDKPQEVLLAQPTLYDASQNPNWRWYHRMFMAHIMFPHIFTVVLGGVFTWLAYRRMWRFHDYGPYYENGPTSGGSEPLDEWQ